MRDTISKFIYRLSWLALILAVVFTALFVEMVLCRDVGVGMLFFFIAPFLSLGMLLLGVIPSSILYFKRRESRDLLSFWLSGCSFVALVIELVVLFCFPLPPGQSF